jgi:hypothetical protein
MAPTDTSGPVDSSLEFYRGALGLLDSREIAFLVGGTFAYSRYTRIDRGTKDLDVFVRPSDVARALTAFDDAGYRTELPYPHWLGKIMRGSDVMDVVFSSGNGIARVDDAWFTYAAEAEILGMRLRLCPLEEMIWSKAFVQERERFDGADILHLLREAGQDLNWERLLARFGEHWAVLLSHLVLFRFAYPDRRDQVPSVVVDQLVRQLLDQREERHHRICYGTLLSREQYLYDIDHLGYRDPRVEPHGALTPRQTRIWTEAIERKPE